MPLGAIKMCSSSSPLLQMGHFLMDKIVYLLSYLLTLLIGKLSLQLLSLSEGGWEVSRDGKLKPKLAGVYLKED